VLARVYGMVKSGANTSSPGVGSFNGGAGFGRKVGEFAVFNVENFFPKITRILSKMAL